MTFLYYIGWAHVFIGAVMVPLIAIGKESYRGNDGRQLKHYVFPIYCLIFGAFLVWFARYR